MDLESSDDGGSGVFTSLSGSNGSSNGGRGRRRKRKNQLNDSFANLIQPLQRFTKREQQGEGGSSGGGDDVFITTFTNPMREKRLEVFDEVESYDFDSSSNAARDGGDNKRIRSSNSFDTQSGSKNDDVDSGDDIEEDEALDMKNEKEEKLKKEMEDLREEVERWKKVNNKLMSKLKKISSK